MTHKIALGALAVAVLALAGCGTLPRTDPSPPAPVVGAG